MRHGGHAAAAGFTVRNENLAELILRMKSIAQTQLCDRDLRRSLQADIEIPLSQLNFDLLKHLTYFEPTGYGNPEALFVSRDVKVKGSRTVGAEGKHLKVTFDDGRGAAIDAIGFRLGELQASLPPRVDVMYTFEPNEYNGRTTLQLNLKDLKATGTED